MLNYLPILEFMEVESMFALKLWNLAYVTLLMYFQNEVLLNCGNSCSMSYWNHIHCELLLVGINVNIFYDIMIEVKNWSYGGIKGNHVIPLAHTRFEVSLGLFWCFFELSYLGLG